MELATAESFRITDYISLQVQVLLHTYRKTPRHPCTAMQFRARGRWPAGVRAAIGGGMATKLLGSGCVGKVNVAQRP